MAKRDQPADGRPVPLSVDVLHLDPNNPRLPDTGKWDPERILEYIRQNGELTELARSFADNGYFVQEPVLVVARRRGGYTVLEGNRRVATLKILLDESESPFIDVELTRERREELKKIPAVILDSEDALHRYVGFRHISGLQPWSAEAKARYIFNEVERHRKEIDPFKVVGRRVGLQSPQVRQAYIAYATLRHGAQDLGLTVDGVTNHARKRFGVWLRAMESPAVREFVGIGSPTEYEDVIRALGQLRRSKKRLQEVINDIGPVQGDSILGDSRQVTIYARVLAHDDALAAKRAENSLETAREIVSRAALADRVSKVERTLDSLTREVSGLERPVADDLLDAASRVRRAAIRLMGALREVADGEDE